MTRPRILKSTKCAATSRTACSEAPWEWAWASSTRLALRWEILEMFRAAAKHEAPCYVHIRHAGDRAQQTSMVALEEVVAASAITGASLHVVHVSSMGLRNTPRCSR